MRIISGFLKSRLIDFPKTRLTRPVTDRSKETIFNILGNRIADLEVLDLFAGSGSFGLEAISRGAGKVCFVDHAPLSIQCIKKNLKSLQIEHMASVTQMDIEKSIVHFESLGKKFGLLFLDPPHNKGFIKKILHVLDASDIVTNHGIIVIGHSQNENLPAKLNTFHIERQVKLGQGYISFLVKKTDNEKN